MSRLERDMKPTSESTALEGSESFSEYAAAGKLKGRKAIITGGESVSTRFCSNYPKPA